MKSFRIRRLLVVALSFYLAVPVSAVGIVDTRTGEVLLFTTPVAVADVINAKEKALSAALESSLKKLPAAP